MFSVIWCTLAQIVQLYICECSCDGCGTHFHLKNFGTEMQMQCNRISRRIWICWHMKSMLHFKAREELYIGSKDVRRFPVPDDKVSWSMAWPDYKPVDYTAPPVLNRPMWADPDFRFVRWLAVFFHNSWAVLVAPLHGCALVCGRDTHTWL